MAHVKVLVTGATGCLGRNLVERLISDGIDVVATGRNAEVGNRIAAMGASFVKADITDTARIIEAARGCDTIYHCAAMAAPWGKLDDFYSANVIGTDTVIRAALKHHARLVHVSTPSVYFDFRDRLDIAEHEPLPHTMVNDYASTKLEAEGRVAMAVDRHGLKAVMLRPRAIFGPWDTALFPRLMAACRNGRVPMVNHGRTLMDVSCVANVIDAMLLASERAGSLSGRIYNISNGVPILFGDLVRCAFKEIGIPFRPLNIPYPMIAAAAWIMEAHAGSAFGKGEPRLTAYSAGVLRYHQTLDISRAREELGYVPRKSTMAGIREYAIWRAEHEGA